MLKVVVQVTSSIVPKPMHETILKIMFAVWTEQNVVSRKHGDECRGTLNLIKDCVQTLKTQRMVFFAHAAEP